MQLYEGSGTGQVVVDGSSGQPAIAADFDLANFQAGPFLNDLAKFDRILGTTESKLSVRTAGASQRELVGNLAGNGAVVFRDGAIKGINIAALVRNIRSEEHTSELQSLMRISYAVFCLKKKNTNKQPTNTK